MLEHRLHQMLYRFDCPAPNVLREYYWGRLAVDQRKEIDEHLKACPHCEAELEALQDFLSTENAGTGEAQSDLVEAALERVRTLIARLVSPEPSLAPALRGEIGEALLFEAEGIAVSVSLEQERSGAHTLFGQVLVSGTTLASGAYARVKEASSGTSPAQTALDENGGFALHGLPAGEYQLIIQLSQQRIVIPALLLRAGR